MTRINLIPVKELSDQHLLAEHREIKRIPNMILSGRFNLFGQPGSYTLGAGHVKFFYNKLAWLYKRYIELKGECRRRNFNISNYAFSFLDARTEHFDLWNMWEPNDIDIEISRQRIQEKLDMKPSFYRWTNG